MKERTNFVEGLKVKKRKLSNRITVAKIKYSAEMDHRKHKKEYLDAYIDFVKPQIWDFEIIINLVNDLISELKKNRILSEEVKVSARIKAYEKARENELEKKKNIKDIFAMEIIAISEKEKKFIENIMNRLLIISERKDINKPNGYVATHFNGIINDGNIDDLINFLNSEYSEDFSIEKIKCLTNNVNMIFENYRRKCENRPYEIYVSPSNIEFQIKTVDVAEKASNGSASHSSYKKEKKRKIKKMFEKDEFVMGIDIPFMWETQNREMAILSRRNSIIKVHPYLEKASNKDEVER